MSGPATCVGPLTPLAKSTPRPTAIPPAKNKGERAEPIPVLNIRATEVAAACSGSSTKLKKPEDVPIIADRFSATGKETPLVAATSAAIGKALANVSLVSVLIISISPSFS